MSEMEKGDDVKGFSRPPHICYSWWRPLSVGLTTTLVANLGSSSLFGYQGLASPLPSLTANKGEEKGIILSTFALEEHWF